MIIFKFKKVYGWFVSYFLVNIGGLKVVLKNCKDECLKVV